MSTSPKTTPDDLVEVPGFPDATVLTQLCRGASCQSTSPWKRRYSCQLELHNGDTRRPCATFETTAVGMFNRHEHATLSMRDHRCEFTRERTRGQWRLDGTLIGEVVLSWSMWQLYIGTVHLNRDNHLHLCDMNFNWKSAQSASFILSAGSQNQPMMGS